MKLFRIIALFLTLLCGTSQAHAKTSFGAVAGYPEIVGAYGSVWPTNDFSIDGYLTLATVDLGLTGHIPVAHHLESRHDILVTGIGGFTHNLVEQFPDRNYHAIIAAGYGYQTLRGWDIRALVGSEVYGTGPVNADFHGHIMVGHLF